MQVGDLVRVLVPWGKVGTVGIVVDLRWDFGNGGPVVTLESGWEYRDFELEVLSEYR